MRGMIIAAISMVAIGLSTAAEAKGCIKGAIVGGIAGHFAGRHGLLGAAAGCVAGRSLANRPKPGPRTAPPAPGTTVQTQ